MRISFYCYEVTRETLEEAQAVLATAEEMVENGEDIDAWFYAGCPVEPEVSR